MKRGRVLWHLVKADFLGRVRRTSFLVTLAFAVFLGYQTFAGHIVMQLDDYRGVYNSAWVGALMGIVTSAFVTLAGFYIVKGAILRDETTRVGQILAATPMSKGFYTTAKFLGNFAVLGAIVFVMAAAALCMQLARAEDHTIHPWALLLPLLLFALPAMAFVAALAVLFETLPVVRGGIGNVIWFFAWTALLVGSVSSAVEHGGATSNQDYFRDFTGISTTMSQMRATLHKVDPAFQGGFSLEIGGKPPHHRFLWTGIRWNTVQVIARFAWFAYAVAVALLASLFFDRFDPARERRTPARPKPADKLRVEELSAARELARADPWSSRLTPLPPAGMKNRFASLVAAELRLMLKGRQWWWYAVAGGLFIGCLASPLEASRSGVILAAWLWPILLWSQMGSREARYATGSLLFSAPHALQRQLPAAWIAGVLVTALTGGGLGIRLLLARDLHGFAGWTVAACFIPSLALALGVWSGSSKFFEALYTVWWYIGAAHHLRGLDYTGTVAVSSTPGLYLALTVALLASCWMRRRTQLAYA
jgi:hypothetical protein